jgi:hypothetical protein
MTPVNTSRLTPTYGASRRTARISITKTEAEVAKTRRRESDWDKPDPDYLLQFRETVTSGPSS